MAAINGDGVALGRGALVTDAIRKGQLVKPFELTVPSKFGYYVVCSRDGVADPSIAAFRNWIIAEGAASQSQLDAVRDGH
jgi:LysR family glycine cleavage system transcriptional activator